MTYFHILQANNIEQIEILDNDLSQLSFPIDRFLEYTDEILRIFYKVPTSESLDLLKKYPAFLTIERFEKKIQIIQIIQINYNKDKQQIIAIFKILDSKDTISDHEQHLLNLFQFESYEKYRFHWALKTGDIFNKLTNDPLLSQFSHHKDKFSNYTASLPIPQYIDLSPIVENSDIKVEVSLSVPSLKETDQQSVSTVSEFIQKIHDFNATVSLEERELFFRGHSDAARYFLQPSLFRQYKNKGPIYLKSEKSSFMDLLTTEPKSFANENRCFDILTHMQHYSFPTRLLDISSNPLAALYFACEIKKNEKGDELDIDGEVILFFIKKSEIKYFDSDSISCLTNLAKLTEEQKDELLTLIKKCTLETPLKEELSTNEYETHPTYARYIHFIRQEKPYFEPKVKISDLNKVLCVKGRLNQDRIIAQAGSFLIYGLESNIPEDGNDIFKIERITIKSSDKKNLLNELDLLKVNLRTIYPSLENTAKYLKEKLEREADKNNLN